MQTDEQAIEGLIVFAVLIIIVIIGSLIPIKKRDTSYDTYNEIWGEQINAMVRLQTLKEMQKRSGKNYSKSISRQKKLIESLKSKLNAEDLKQKFKSNFKDVSKDEKIDILEKALLNRLNRENPFKPINKIVNSKGEVSNYWPHLGNSNFRNNYKNTENHVQFLAAEHIKDIKQRGFKAFMPKTKAEWLMTPGDKRNLSEFEKK